MKAKLNLKKLMEERKKSKYWLVKKLETDYRYATKLIEGETKSITFEMIGKLCMLFECTPNELFVVEEDDTETL